MSASDTADSIKRFRTMSGMTQSELARKAGLPQPVISAYENGRREPSAETFRRVFEAMGISLRPALGPPAKARRYPPDQFRAGRLLREVLDLSDRLPVKRRGELTFPSLARVDTATSDTKVGSAKSVPRNEEQ